MKSRASALPVQFRLDGVLEFLPDYSEGNQRCLLLASRPGIADEVGGEFPGVCHSSVNFSVKLAVIWSLISSHLPRASSGSELWLCIRVRRLLSYCFGSSPLEFS